MPVWLTFTQIVRLNFFILISSRANLRMLLPPHHHRDHHHNLHHRHHQHYEYVHKYKTSYIKNHIAPQETRTLLSRIVEQYNFIHDKTEKSEFDIVFDQVEMIDAKAAVLVDTFTWQHFGKYHGRMTAHAPHRTLMIEPNQSVAIFIHGAVPPRMPRRQLF